MEKTGKVIEVISAVLDIRFEKDELPFVNEAVIIDTDHGPLTVEVAQDMGDGIVRCIALGPTDGLRRGRRTRG